MDAQSFELRILIGPEGVRKVQIAAESLEAQRAGTALYERLAPAVMRLNRVVRRGGGEFLRRKGRS